MRTMSLPETAAGFLTPGSRASALGTERNTLDESRISGKTQFLKMIALKNGGPAAYRARAQGVPGVQLLPSQVAYRKSAADPIRDVLGAGRISHPEEWATTLAELAQGGVEIMLSTEERLAYAPAPWPGSPGQIHLQVDASIGALRHEFQHYLDDQAAGFLGTRGLYDLAFRTQTESKAYAIEIKMMEEMGEQETVAQLRQNLRDELFRLQQDLGDIEIL